MEVRPATSDDIPALAGVLARAFDDDPVTRWVYGEGSGRSRWTRRFFAWQLRRLLAQDLTWTADPRAGAAIWALPDRWREGTVDVLRLMWATLPGVLPRTPRILRGLGQVEEHHPEHRHLYLAVLGVEPERQGAGLGAALLRPGLELCDREGLPAYLETATERNVAFHSRQGFRVTGEVGLPAGPTIRLMWRDPR
jgi:ribosomal protein S18 acetylase RimI-like enzyme